MKLLIDMNLSPALCPLLKQAGHGAVHWSDVGGHRATDREIMNWADAHGHVVLTHDLDFGAILAVTQASGPSVVQVRTQDVTPARLAPIVLRVLERHKEPLDAGALVAVDEARSRVRVLPIASRA